MSALLVAPNTASNLNLGVTRPDHRRRRRDAVELVARSAAGLVNLPVIQDSARVTQELAKALKAPGRNDTIAQEQIDRVDRVMAYVLPFAEELSAVVDDLDSSGLAYLVALQSLIDDLIRIKVELAEIKNEKYATKLAYQKNIDRLLEEKYQEFMERTRDFCIDGTMRANQGAIRTLRLEQRVDVLNTLLAECTANIVAVRNVFFLAS